jgi:hypothetical protein
VVLALVVLYAVPVGIVAVAVVATHTHAAPPYYWRFRLFFCFPPLFAEFFEFYITGMMSTSRVFCKRMGTIWTPLGAMFLHCDMGIQMIESAIRLCAIWPGTLVEAFDFIVPSPGTLFNGVSGQGYERVSLAVGGALDGAVARAATLVCKTSVRVR